MVKWLLSMGAKVGACNAVRAALCTVAAAARTHTTPPRLTPTPCVCEQHKENALHEAVKDGFVDVLGVLLAALPKKLVTAQRVLNAQDDRERTALHYAAARDRAGAVRLLVKAGADINARGNRGRTPLHSGAYCGSGDAVRALCELGADLNALDVEGDSPCDDAAGKGRLQTLAIMQQFGAKPGPPKKTAPNYSALVQMTGAPLLHAVKERDQEKVAALAGAGHDINGGDIQGITALHVAAQQNDVAALRVLLAAGAIVNLPDKRGNTALHYAAGFGSAEAAQLLLEAGAFRFQENSAGMCPHHVVKRPDTGEDGDDDDDDDAEDEMTPSELAAARELPMLPFRSATHRHRAPQPGASLTGIDEGGDAVEEPPGRGEAQDTAMPDLGPQPGEAQPPSGAPSVAYSKDGEDEDVPMARRRRVDPDRRRQALARRDGVRGRGRGRGRGRKAVERDQSPSLPPEPRILLLQTDPGDVNFY